MRNRALTTVVRASCRVYGLLLPLYPSTLRWQFGADMTDVFEQQIRGECEQRGFLGVVHVWCCVAAEVMENALPGEFQWASIGVPIASMLMSLALFEGILRATGLASHCAK